METIYWTSFGTPWGKFSAAATRRGLVGLTLPGEGEQNLTPTIKGREVNLKKQNTPLLRKTAKELHEYLVGKRKQFSVPLDPFGSPFQKRVWKALCSIPYGQTRSYGEIARRVGNPRASRAVGNANNRNPIAVIVPCHRVIGANGALVGYGGGLRMKRKILALEKKSGKAR